VCLKILLKGNRILNKLSSWIDNFDDNLFALISDMTETMYKAKGVGLSAVQVGVLKTVIVIDIGDGIIELVNPVIVDAIGERRSEEGCLSCPGEYGVILRPDYVKVEALNRFGKKFRIEGSGLLASVLCHEIDHINGILFESRFI